MVTHGRNMSAVPQFLDTLLSGWYAGHGQFMAWKSDTGSLIAGGAMDPSASANYSIFSLTPPSNTWTQIGSFVAPSVGSMPGATAYCPNTKTLLFEVSTASSRVAVLASLLLLS